MANIPQLVASARSIKSRSDQSVGWKLAAMKAVEASGVTHKPDVKRISGEVFEELRKSGDVPNSKSSTRLWRFGRRVRHAGGQR